MANDKQKALDAALAGIAKQFGEGAAMKMGDQPIRRISSIPSGSITLDRALGIGGWPRGRIVELFGAESSGKTTAALHATAEAQAAGGIVAFVDAEHALDPTWAAKLGVDVDELVVSQPDNGEQALEIVEALVRSGAIDLVVVDSVAALTPKAEIEGEMGDSHVGLQARLMSQALRKLNAIVHDTDTIVIFINQLREKIGVMFGSPLTTPGGRALKFYASVRCQVTRVGQEKVGEVTIGSKVEVKVVKNKVAPPFTKADFVIRYDSGIDGVGSMIDLGVEHDVLRKAGAWYAYGDDNIGQGKEKTREYLLENPEVYAEIDRKVRTALGIDGDDSADGVPEDASELAGV